MKQLIVLMNKVTVDCVNMLIFRINTVDPRLSELGLSKHLNYPNAKSDCSIRLALLCVLLE